MHNGSNMSATNKKVFVLSGAFFALLAFMPTIALAQSFGGTSSSTLYTPTGSSTFQNSALSQGSTNTSQATTTLTALQQTAVTSTIQVVGAPASAPSTGSNSSSMENTTNEVVVVAFIIGILSFGVLFVLLRQLKSSK